MRQVHRAIVIVAFILAEAMGATLSMAQDKPKGITVFVAKEIITMDPGWPTASAVAVQDGKILSVGSL
jgi:predicted amidohydrolase YtcJ